MILTYLMLFVALALSAIAAYYSIVGLMILFAAAAIPVAVMASVLELAKVVATSWVYRNWTDAPRLIRYYLVVSIIVLMTITSMGIFGFLSKAHVEQGTISGDVQSRVSLIDERIKIQKDNIDTARKALTQMDSQVNERLSRGSTEQGVERAALLRRQQQQERNKLLQEISTAQGAIEKLNEERAPIAAQLRRVEAEVGPLKYIAELFYDNVNQSALETSVRWVIILLVSVFDPLAIILLVAANYSLKHRTHIPTPVPLRPIKTNIPNWLKESIRGRKLEQTRKNKNTIEINKNAVVYFK